MPSFAEVVGAFEQELRGILDPEAVDAQAKADQRAKVEAFGREKVLSRGAFANSPTPGEIARLRDVRLNDVRLFEERPLPAEWSSD